MNNQPEYIYSIEDYPRGGEFPKYVMVLDGEPLKKFFAKVELSRVQKRVACQNFAASLGISDTGLELLIITKLLDKRLNA